MIPLPVNEVHIWTWLADGEEPATLVEHDLLDEQEKKRMARFRFSVDRYRFLHRHLGMRKILARYTGMEASSLRFTFNPYGKPRLKPANSSPNIHFSLSHSRGFIAMAVIRGRKIGMDVEHIKSSIDPMSLAEGCFAPEEVELLRSTSPARRLDVFFRIWTLKEAYIKACGLGLSLPLKSFSFKLGEHIGLCYAPIEHGGQNWQFGQWLIQENYLAVAVPVEQKKPPLHFVFKTFKNNRNHSASMIQGVD